MMSGSFTYRGSFKRRSVVITAGRSTSSVSSPASTSRVTRACPFGQLDLRGESGLRTIPQSRQHLAGLAVVVVDGLFTEDDHHRLLFLHQLQQRAGRGERLDYAVRLHVQCAIRTHGQGGAELLLAIGRSDRRDDDLFGATSLLDPQRLFERDLIERVDAHLHPVGDDAAAVRFDADAYVVIHDTLDADEDAFH